MFVGHAAPPEQHTSHLQRFSRCTWPLNPATTRLSGVKPHPDNLQWVPPWEPQRVDVKLM